MHVPRRIGRYDIDGVLGQGGMGVVYRARRPGGESCALKTVLKLQGRRLELLRREIHALSRLDHPGIVKVLDQGVHDGCPWYAMELLDSATLADRFRAVWGDAARATPHTWPAAALRADLTSAATGELATPAAVARARPADAAAAASARATAGQQALLTIFQQLCRPIAFLHGEGLVHCDLKPGNVFFRADGSPVIGDFSLAAHVAGAYGRDLLEVETEVCGTAAYMAPEQIEGRAVDARADLYALGCMLYEAVTGRPPFAGDVPEVLGAHLTRMPAAPSSVAPHVPASVDALILRLLAKDPRQRLGFAEDVAKVLEPVCGRASEAPSLPRPRAYVYRPGFVGRDDDLSQLLRLVGQIRDGCGGCVFVSGESGVGKTRLAAETGVKARSQGVRVVTGRCSDRAREGAGGSPLEPLTPLLREIADRCVEGGPDATARLLGGHGPVLAAYERSLAGVPGASGWPEPARLRAEDAVRRLVDALADTLERAAEDDEGLLLILDDLQWADELTLTFLARVAPRLSNSRVLLLGTYRAEERGPELEAVVAAPGVRHLRLARLDPVSVGAMVGDMLALREPAPGFVAFLSEQSEGNPFFVAEYVRTAIAEQVLYRDDLGRWQLRSLYRLSDEAFRTLPLPGSLRELVALRLTSLAAEARELVGLAAVFGREFESRMLEAATELGGGPYLDAVHELIARQVLEQTWHRLRFVHHKLSEISYDAVPPGVRTALHLRAAATIARLKADALELADHADLGRHFSRGGRPADAVGHYRAAADLSAEIYANAHAIEYYEQALRQAERAAEAGVPPSREFLVDCHDRAGTLLALAGKHAAARQAFANALALCSSADRLPAAGIYCKLGKTWETHHAHADALAAYDAAAGRLGDEPADPVDRWWETWISIRLDRAWVHYWRGAADRLEAELDSVRPVVTRGGASAEARFYELLALLGSKKERFLISTETMDYAQRAFDAIAGSAGPAELAEALFELGFTQVLHGDFPAAAATLTEALDRGSRVGDITRQARCVAYLTMCHRRSGRVQLAETFARRSLEVAQEAGIPMYVASARATLGWVAFKTGRYADAYDLCRSALDLWRTLDVAFPFYWLAAFPLAALCLARGEHDEALALVDTMLAPSQQRFPDDLAAALEAARAPGCVHRERTAALVRAMSAAENHGYL